MVNKGIEAVPVWDVRRAGTEVVVQGAGSTGEAIQCPAAACNARGNNRAIVECSVLMAMESKNGRIPPACPVAPDNVQVLQKNPSNRLGTNPSNRQKLIQTHAKLPRVIWQSSGFAGTFCVLSEC